MLPSITHPECLQSNAVHFASRRFVHVHVIAGSTPENLFGGIVVRIELNLKNILHSVFVKGCFAHTIRNDGASATKRFERVRQGIKHHLTPFVVTLKIGKEDESQSVSPTIKQCYNPLFPSLIT